MVISRHEKAGDVDLRQIDDNVVDAYTTRERDYPILERTNNALLWPEEIKGGIDLSDYDAATVTEVPEDPHKPLNTINFDGNSSSNRNDHSDMDGAGAARGINDVIGDGEKYYL